MRRLSPLSPHYGVERGQPIDRYYIENFLAKYSADIKGRVLEIQSSGYTRQFGKGRVNQSDVLDIDSANPQASLVVDLSKADGIPSGQFDCFILTQSLQYMFDLKSALGHAFRILKPEGVLLVSVPAIARIDPGARATDYWRFTPMGLCKLMEEHTQPQNIEITVHGNVLSDFGFLMGLSHHELSERELNTTDTDFPLVLCARAVKS
ncbi:MAG: methyltransferase domain-containing protein [Candidatus Omnitrophica bacterium]|nr:methyltransferase domain-containing protein [Candidatus Omnitrophota bacterium]